MSKGIILYQSNYGSTEKYARWLSEATGFELMETRRADIAAVEGYDTVILGGGVYASGILGLSFLKKNIDRLQGKKLAVFCVCASPYDEKFAAELRQLHFKDKMSGIPVFHCRGAWDMEKMTFMHRTLCKMLQKAVAKKDPSQLESWEQALVEAGSSRCDWTDKSYLEPLLAFIDGE